MGNCPNSLNFWFFVMIKNSSVFHNKAGSLLKDHMQSFETFLQKTVVNDHIVITHRIPVLRDFFICVTLANEKTFFSSIGQNKQDCITQFQ